MMKHLVEAERSEILADISPSNFTLVRVSLEMPLVRIRETRKLPGVVNAGNSVTNDERFLQCGVEGAGKNPVRDVIARHDVEHCLRVHARNAQMSRAEE